MVQIIPVIDVLHGNAVHAVKGIRGQYQPVAVPDLEEPSPRALASWYRTRFGLNQIYIANLDAIMETNADSSWLGEMLDSGFQILLDAGRMTLDQCRSWPQVDKLTPVIGLEVIRSIADLNQTLEQAVTQFSNSIFSIDLRGGELICRATEMESWSVDELVTHVYSTGVRNFIVLDLAHVGSLSGGGVLDLVRRLNQKFPDAHWISGGGIRNAGDVASFGEAGCASVLVATALLNGAIDPKTVR